MAEFDFNRIEYGGSGRVPEYADKRENGQKKGNYHSCLAGRVLLVIITLKRTRQRLVDLLHSEVVSLL